MTTQNLIDFVVSHAQFDLDLYAGESPTNAQVVDLLNWGQRLLSRKLWLYDPRVAITLVAGTQSYDLRSSSVAKDIWLPDRAYINGSPLFDYQGENIGLWSLSEVEAIYPSWSAAANGTPTVAFISDRKIYYYLKPSSSVVSGGSNYVGGCCLAADLSSSSLSASPDLPEEVHEALGYLATARGSIPNCSEQEGWARLKEYEAKAAEQVEEIALQNMMAVKGGWRDRS